jgi:hypothetical protein
MHHDCVGHARCCPPVEAKDTPRVSGRTADLRAKTLGALGAPRGKPPATEERQGRVCSVLANQSSRSISLGPECRRDGYAVRRRRSRVCVASVGGILDARSVEAGSCLQAEGSGNLNCRVTAYAGAAFSTHSDLFLYLSTSGDTIRTLGPHDGNTVEEGLKGCGPSEAKPRFGTRRAWGALPPGEQEARG